MILFSFIRSAAFVLTLVATLGFKLSVTAKDAVDVCVIGAGPSGIQAAYSAEASGYTTAVFEKDNYLGGKTKQFTAENGEKYGMGAMIHSRSKPGKLNSLYEAFQDRLPPRRSPNVPLSLYDSNDDSAEYTIPNPALLLWQIFRFAFKRTLLAPKLNAPDAYLSKYSEELNTLTIQEWLEKNRSPLLIDLFWFFQTTFGYGHPKDIPAVFMLKYFDASTFLGFVLVTLGRYRLSRLELFPFQDLLIAMADTLQGTIYLSATITDVAYKTNENTMTFRIGESDADQVITCGSTIIAFPPTSNAMTLFTPPGDNGTSLQALTSKVQIVNYFTLLVEDTTGAFGTRAATFYHTPESRIPDNPATNVFYFKQIPSSPLVVTYYLSPSEKTNEQAMQESLESFGRYIGAQVNETNVRDFNRWPYFPHVSSGSLQNGFFADFEATQGMSRQYYTGGLFNFETVQDSMDHARYIVETYL